MMIPNVTSVRQVGPYQLELVFNDGTTGVLNFQEFLKFEGVFEPLRDPDYFARVAVDPEAGTIVWPNGADLDPIVLHSRVTGKPIQLEVASSRR